MFQLSLVNFFLVQEKISIDFDLYSKDGNLLCIDLQLVWLAVEWEAVNWFDQALWWFEFHKGISCICGLSSNKSKLDVRVKVGADIFEWQLELLDSSSLLDGKGDQLRISGLVEELFDTLDLWVVQVTKEKDIDFATNFGFLLNNICRIVVQVFFETLWLVVASELGFCHFNVYKRYDSRLQFVFGSFNNNNEFLTHWRTNL